MIAQATCAGDDAAHRAAAGALHHPRSRRGAAALAGAGRDRAAARAAAGRNRRAAGRIAPRWRPGLAASRSSSISATSAITGSNTMRRRSAALTKSFAGWRPPTASISWPIPGRWSRPAAHAPAIVPRSHRGDRQRRHPGDLGPGHPARLAGSTFCSAGGPSDRRFRLTRAIKLRSIFDRLGWDAQGHENDDQELLRARLIRMLGELGDAADSGRGEAAVRRLPAKSRTRCGRRCASR